MAAAHSWWADRSLPRPDALCPLCFSPSLKTLTLLRIDLAGVTPVATRTWCRDERRFVDELVPLPETEEASP